MLPLCASMPPIISSATSDPSSKTNRTMKTTILRTPTSAPSLGIEALSCQCDVSLVSEDEVRGPLVVRPRTIVAVTILALAINQKRVKVKREGRKTYTKPQTVPHQPTPAPRHQDTQPSQTTSTTQGHTVNIDTQHKFPIAARVYASQRRGPARVAGG